MLSSVSFPRFASQSVATKAPGQSPVKAQPGQLVVGSVEKGVWVIDTDGLVTNTHFDQPYFVDGLLKLIANNALKPFPNVAIVLTAQSGGQVRADLKKLDLRQPSGMSDTRTHFVKPLSLLTEPADIENYLNDGLIWAANNAPCMKH